MQEKDKRVARTKQKLYAAYLQLLTRKVPEDISIQMLTLEASVNRVTFYKHFQNIASFHQSFIQHYLEELYSFMKPLNYKEYSKGFEYDALLQLLSHIKINAETYRVLLASPYMKEFNQQLLFFFQKKIMTHTTELARFEFPGTGVAQEIVAWYGVSALCGCIIMWARANFSYAPEQLARSIVELSPHSH